MLLWTKTYLSNSWNIHSFQEMKELHWSEDGIFFSPWHSNIWPPWAKAPVYLFTKETSKISKSQDISCNMGVILHRLCPFVMCQNVLLVFTLKEREKNKNEINIMKQTALCICYVSSAVWKRVMTSQSLQYDVLISSFHFTVIQWSDLHYWDERQIFKIWFNLSVGLW